MRTLEVLCLCSVFVVLASARLPGASRSAYENTQAGARGIYNAVQPSGTRGGRIMTASREQNSSQGNGNDSNNKASLERNQNGNSKNSKRDEDDDTVQGQNQGLQKTKTENNQDSGSGGTSTPEPSPAEGESGLGLQLSGESDDEVPIHCPCRQMEASGSSECFNVTDKETMRCKPRPCGASYECDSSVTDMICMLRKASKKTLGDVLKPGYCMEKVIDESFYVFYDAGA